LGIKAALKGEFCPRGPDSYISRIPQRKSGMSMNRIQRTYALALALPILLALAGSCSGPTEPETIPPRILYFYPHADTLTVREEGQQLFVLQGIGGASLEYTVEISGQSEALTDSFVFRPAELGLSWPTIDHDSVVTVRMALRDGPLERFRDWRVNVRVTPGLEIIAMPDTPELSTTAGEPVLLGLDVRNGDPDGPIEFSFTRDGSLVSSDAQYLFPADRLGPNVVKGIVRWTVEGLPYWDSYTWIVDVLPCEDDLEPPPTIDDLRVGPGPTLGSLSAAFTPPVDPNGELQRYELRVFYSPLDADQWETTYLVGTPEADPEAGEERFTIAGLDAGRTIYMRVRSFDLCCNASAWSNLAGGPVAGHTVSGVVLDFETGAPRPGLSVRYGSIEDVTGPDGRFRCADVRPLPANQTYPPGYIWDDAAPESWYMLRDYRAVDDSLEKRLGSFHSQPFAADNYDDFLEFFLHMVNAAYWENHLVRPIFPIRVWVTEYVNEGLDYAAATRDAMATWESAVGLDLFEEAPDSSQASLYFRIWPDDTQISGEYEVILREPGTATPLLMAIDVDGSGDAAAYAGVRRILLHELGHALGLWNHSDDVDHLMNYTATVDGPTHAEIRVVRILYHMDRWEDLLLFRER